MKRPHKSRATTTSSTTKGRILRLAAETVRTLGSSDLANAVSGCDTTSWTTEKPTQPVGG